MKHDELFEHLEPRPGGLGRLRARLDARPRVGRLLVSFSFAAAATLAAASVLLLARPRGPDLVGAARARGGDASEIELGLLPMPHAAITLTTAQRPTAALAEVPTTNPNVSFYWVSSTSWSD